MIGLTDRFKDAPWYNPSGEMLTIGGLGGLGSWLALLLARQNHSIFAYDLDIVSKSNLGGQLYSSSQIGMLKTKASTDNIKLFADNNIQSFGEFIEGSMVTDICFSPFDKIEPRRKMFNAWVNLQNKELFIDGRMQAEGGQIITVCNSEEAIEAYKKYFLFEESDVEEGSCTYRATSHGGVITASLMVSMFNNYQTNRNLKMEVREVPFYQEFHLELNKFINMNIKDYGNYIQEQTS